MERILLALFLLTGAAHADELLDTAVTGQAADVAVTVAGLTLVDGLVEANPLGVAIIPLKIGLVHWADSIEDPQDRADALRVTSATGWGPAVHNLCAIGVVASGGGSVALCLIVGIAAGIADWHRTARMRPTDTTAQE